MTMSSWAPVTAETKAVSIFPELRYVEVLGVEWSSSNDVASPKVVTVSMGRSV